MGARRCNSRRSKDCLRQSMRCETGSAIVRSTACVWIFVYRQVWTFVCVWFSSVWRRVFFSSRGNHCFPLLLCMVHPYICIAQAVSRSIWWKKTYFFFFLGYPLCMIDLRGSFEASQQTYQSVNFGRVRQEMYRQLTLWRLASTFFRLLLLVHINLATFVFSEACRMIDMTSCCMLLWFTVDLTTPLWVATKLSTLK